jgi:hypothetical protein
MSDGSNEKPMPASSDAAARRRGLDWPHALVELATVVIGILIALAVNNWAETRHNATLEARYLERLLADSAENLTMLQERIDLLTRRTDQLTRLSRWLTDGTERPTDEEISEVLCRWFIQPALRLRRETYAELVSTGNLSLLRDVPLRGLLEQAETRHEELIRLDRFTDILQRVTEPLNRYRQWEINPNARRGIGCRFDFNGMRSDPVIPSILAQICRDETINRAFCEQELAAVRTVHDRIMRVQPRP